VASAKNMAWKNYPRLDELEKEESTNQAVIER